MLLIASTASHTDATALACAIVKRLAATAALVAVKVSLARSGDDGCASHCGGCPVCSGLDRGFAITEGAAADQVVGELAAAGAKRALWLRAKRDSRGYAVDALLQQLGGATSVVCGSSDLASVVRPELCLVAGAGEAEQAAFADEVVRYDGSTFDFDFGRLGVLGGHWTLRREATAIILAGGESRRMQTDKSMLPIGGVPMIEHIHRQLAPNFSEILVSANDPAKYAFLGSEVVPDEEPGQGPVMGLASVLRASGNDLNFVCACDMPQVDMLLVRWMLRELGGSDAVVPATGDLLEPLCAVYRKTMVPAFEAVLATGKRRVVAAFDGADVHYLDIGGRKAPQNLNTREEYDGFLAADDLNS